MAIQPIHTEANHDAAVACNEALWNARLAVVGRASAPKTITY